MILILFLILIVGLLSGCSNNTKTAIVLKNPQPTNNSNQMVTENDYFKIKFNPIYDMGLRGIKATITNKVDDTLKINWNEGSFVTPDNQASRAIPGNVSFIDISKKIPNTIIPSGAKSEIIIAPEKNIYKSDAYVGSIDYENNSTFSILFPIIIDNEKKEFRYDFEIKIYDN